MADNQPQFDALLGGCQDLPQDISVMNVVASRAQEILSLTEALQEPKKTGLVFQRLPRHMRRRVMSHNAKRMPRQLREAHIRQMEKSGLPPRSKRPSRKYRRRPSNLLSAYNRRQRNNVWLETHIWHAKRFHMASKWGYRLAHFPNDKSERACYRGAANHCLIQDISYYVCIEIEGEFERITDGLERLTRHECGLTFNSKSCIKGNRQGTVTVFRSDEEYPFGAIGNVMFLWKPTNSPDGVNKIGPSTDTKCEGRGDIQVGKRTIWLWVHPSCYSELKENLMKLFCMKPCVSASGNTSDEQELKSSETDLESMIKGDDYEGSCIKMKILKDNLNRFRLTGPLSLAVLRESFQLECVEGAELGEGQEWWMHWRNVFTCQRKVWKDLNAISSVSPYSVLGLTILDPRCHLPGKKIKAVDSQQMHRLEMIQDGLPQEACLSPIWNHEIREYVTKSKPTEADINKRRGENLVPGISEMDDVKDAAQIIDGSSTRVPILLVQRPGNQEAGNNRLGYCSGWDIISPAGWGKPLWLALILRGARAGGLRESETLDNENFSQRVCWPPLPDTNAYKAEMKQLEIESKDKYFRYPPDKRSNYIKLGISSPFCCSWSILCREWSEDDTSSEKTRWEDNYYVLRNIRTLKRISELLENKRKEAISRHKSEMEVVVEAPKEDIKSFFDGISNDDLCCLVPVRLKAHKKGNIKDFAIVCLPKKKDLKSFTQLNEEFKGPLERIHPDPNEEERKRLLNEHKRKLKKLRRKRVKDRKEAEEKIDIDGPSTSESNTLLRGPSATEEMCAEHREKMRELYLPDATQVRNSCSREVMGFVTNGAFSYSHAKEMGVAYVTLASIVSLLHTCTWNPYMLIFVRNTNCRNYIPALIEIIKD